MQVFFDTCLHVFGREDISSVVLGWDVKRAELAELVADIRVVDVLVTDVPGNVAAHPFSNDVGEIPDRIEIGRGVKRQPVFERKTLAGFHFLADFFKFRWNWCVHLDDLEWIGHSFTQF
jgi:hypothetical protein